MPSSLRQRAGGANASPSAPMPTPPPRKNEDLPSPPSKKKSRLHPLVTYGLPATILCLLYGYNPFTELAKVAASTWRSMAPTRVYTSEELAAENARDGGLLVVVGRIYDVSAGMHNYGPDSAYGGFLGKDGSRAFVTGDFTEEGFTDDVSDFTEDQCQGLNNWVQFYADEAKYPAVGLLHGRYYDEAGRPTEALKSFKECVAKGLQSQMNDDVRKREFPVCNMKWSQAEGGRVWCDNNLVPRKPTEEARERFGKPGRCSCFDVTIALTNTDLLEGYHNCAAESSMCMTKPPGAQ